MRISTKISTLPGSCALPAVSRLRVSGWRRALRFHVVFGMVAAIVLFGCAKEPSTDEASNADSAAGETGVASGDEAADKSGDESAGTSVAETATNAIEAAKRVQDLAASRVSEGSRQVQGRDGAALPDGFPIYAGAVPSDDVPETDRFRWDTAASISDVGDFYEAALDRAPWGVFHKNRMSNVANVIVFKRATEAFPMGRISLTQGPGGTGTTILLDFE